LFKRLSKDKVVDEWGGFVIKFDQYDFGHVAHKDTRLYICGLSIDQLPPMPPKNLATPVWSIAGNIEGTKRCTQYQREYTPENLINFFEKILDIIIENKKKELISS
jgi:hypothetical protein